MRLAVICDDYLPHSTRVGAKMLHELAKELIAQGHSITVITPQSNPDSKPIYSDNFDGVTIWRFKSGPIKDIGKIRRAINESLLSFNAWQFIKKRVKADTFDGIIYYSPSIFFGLLVSKLKKLCNCKSYLVLRDFFPQWAIDSGLINKNSLIEFYFRFFETQTYKNADMIGVMSPSSLQVFNKMTKNSYRASVLRNWANLQPHKILDATKNNIRNRHNLMGKIIFFYGGNIGKAQDMKNLMFLVKSMQKYNNAHFLFIGQGDEVGLINKLATEWELCNYTYLSSVSQDEYKDILTQVDVGLISLSRKHTTHNFPGKLLSYMLESLPILGSVNPNNDLTKLIHDNNAGYISVNGDNELLYKNAVKLYKSHALRQKMGLAGNNTLRKYFNVSIIAKMITDSLIKT